MVLLSGCVVAHVRSGLQVPGLGLAGLQHCSTAALQHFAQHGAMPWSTVEPAVQHGSAAALSLLMVQAVVQLMAAAHGNAAWHLRGSYLLYCGQAELRLMAGQRLRLFTIAIAGQPCDVALTGTL